MSRTKGLIDGFWYYYIYDIDTHELIMNGTDSDCSIACEYSPNHFHNVIWQLKNNPKYKPKWEIVKRVWVPYKHAVTDTKTGETFVGSRDECRHWMESQLNRKLTDANFINYWYQTVKRFERKKI